MGREMPDHDLVICAANGASLGLNWDPNGPWPVGQPNLYMQCIAFAHAVEAANGSRVDAIVWEQGESDASDADYANAYAANLAAISQLFLTEFPCAQVTYYRLHASGPSINLGAYSQVDLVHEWGGRVHILGWVAGS